MLPRAVHTPRLALLLAAAVVLAAGCSRVLASYDVGPTGLARTDESLRRLLATQHYDSALTRVGPKQKSAPSDDLLRLLYEGVFAHYAGRYAESSSSLERAADLAEDRYTKSISRGALSVVTSDKILAYEPSATERLLIHYYDALNYLKRGDTDDAAVEARRLSKLLERYQDAGYEGDVATLRFLRYFAGAVFEAAGEASDADVAYRNALALAGSSVLPLDTAAKDASGEVVVLLERGFAPHRVEDAVVVVLVPEEVKRLTGGEGDERLGAAALVATRVLARALTEWGDRPFDWRPHRTLHVGPPDGYRPPERKSCEADKAKEDSRARADVDDAAAPPRSAVRGHPKVEAPPADTTKPAESGQPAADTAKPAAAKKPSRSHDCDDDDDLPYIMKIAWPTLTLERRLPHLPIAVVTAEGQSAESKLSARLTESVRRDFENDRDGMVARTIVRSAAKLAVTRSVQKKAGEKDEALGKLVGALTNASGALLEQADTRSWHLLPGEIALVRLRLPVGRQSLTLRMGEGADAGSIDLGAVDLRAGQIAFVSARVWR